MSSYLAEYLKPFDPLFEDRTVIEVVVNGDGHCYVERQGLAQMVRAAAHDITPQAAKDIAQQSANESATALTEKAPLLSTSVEHAGMMLRVQAVIPPASASGTVLSFRIFRPGHTGAPRTFDFLRDDVTASQDEERTRKQRHIEGIARVGRRWRSQCVEQQPDKTLTGT